MTLFATCVLFYVISGILFWTTDYFTDVLSIPKEEITIAFGLTSITAPVLGAISSIPLESKIGFNSNYTLPTCLFFSLVCYGVGVFIPAYETKWGVIVHIWFLLFFGGMLLPIANGRMLAVVNKKHLAHSQSLCFMCFNLFGWLPAPAIYGMICDLSGEGKKSRWGMWALTQTILLAVGFFLLAGFQSNLKACYNHYFVP
jgi:hypothetical protein